MKVIKLTTSFNHSFFNSQLNPALPYRFEIDNDVRECDVWVVWGDLPEGVEKMQVSCPPSKLVYMTDEAFVEKKFDQSFLNQFSAVITCREDITHRQLIKTHEINTWHLKKSFAELYNHTPVKKEKMISVVSSDLTLLPGHKKRYAFVNRLIGHFKDRLDVFGRGFNPVANKWDALAPYKYSVAIENSALPGYFTEKIAECYLAHSFPIYYGAPDLDRYFDPGSYLRIDVDDYKGSIMAIEKLLEEDPWQAKEQLLIEQKLAYLSRYQLYPALCTAVDRLVGNSEGAKTNTVRAHRTYEKYYRIKKLARTARKRWGA